MLQFPSTCIFPLEKFQNLDGDPILWNREGSVNTHYTYETGSITYLFQVSSLCIFQSPSYFSSPLSELVLLPIFCTRFTYTAIKVHLCLFYPFINRPGVAWTVLQTPSLLIN